MGFFDRFAAKKDSSPAPASPPPAQGDPAAAPGSVKARLAAAREKLDAKDLPAALAIYEELLATAGDRPDVLVTLSGDLGSCGHVRQIIELVAPRYDAERHGPATGINLLQAYLATHNATAAQHLLDILFGLNRPELEQRLYGFSNALAELIEAERTGNLPPATNGSAPHDSDAAASGEGAAPAVRQIHLITISRPIWSYGLEAAAPALLPPKEGRLRRIAFAQLALPDVPDAFTRMARPEDELGRLTRSLPLWLAETMYFSPHYSPFAAIGMSAKDHYALFGTEWTVDNLRQLADTTDGGLDYILTGALRHRSGDYELTLRLWEVKKFRERKTFTVRWTPATAAAELSKLQASLRTFMEWTPCPAGAGIAYAAPADPLAWCDTLGASLSFFLNEKALLPAEQLAPAVETLARIAARAAASESASLAWLAVSARAEALGHGAALPADAPLADTPAVAAARAALGM